MTLLSVVLPVYRVQGYLRQCLDSLLSQSFTDFELIAVDDCSPDHCAAILAEYAARDRRVRVLTSPVNVGLGPARNLGLQQCIGKFVWFVDSDDWLAAGALAAVAERLHETDAEVLLVGFDRVHWDGPVELGSAHPILVAAPPSFSVDQWPQVLTVLHVAWNKIVRRDLLARLDVAFQPGWYEDISFSYPVLLAAERISTLPRVCVHYRQRRIGAITRTVADRHFEVFAQWERVLDRSKGCTDEVRGLLFHRMIWHYLQVFRHGSRVPVGLRRRFFRRMTENYQRYRPPAGYRFPPGTEALRHRLVARGRYRLFRAVELAVRVLQVVRPALRRGTGWSLRTAKQARQVGGWLYYQVQRRLPIDDSLALYAAYWYRGVACNPAAIAAKAVELAPRVRAVWVVSRGNLGALPAGTEHVVAGTFAYYRAIGRARFLVNNVNWPNHLVKRPGTTHVMTHHGTPLKLMGIDQQDHPAGVRDSDFRAQLSRMDRWDFQVTANAHTTVAWERAYPGEHETLEVGYPRNDRLVTATAAELVTVRGKLGLDLGQRVVLYAPTYRDWSPAGRQLLAVEEFAADLGPDTVLLVRDHYFSVPTPWREQQAAVWGAVTTGAQVVDVSGYNVVEELYLAADVLVTDYSSVMFDFAVLDRPLVIFAPDWPVYRELRGVYFDLLAEPPGVVATEYDHLREIFHSGAYASGGATAARAKFRAKFCHLEDGKAADRVVRRVFLETDP